MVNSNSGQKENVLSAHVCTYACMCVHPLWADYCSCHVVFFICVSVRLITFPTALLPSCLPATCIISPSPHQSWSTHFSLNQRTSTCRLACMGGHAHGHVLCLKPLDIPKTEASFNYPLITVLITCHTHIHHLTKLRAHTYTHARTRAAQTQVYSQLRLIESSWAPIDQTDRGKWRWRVDEGRCDLEENVGGGEVGLGRSVAARSDWWGSAFDKLLAAGWQVVTAEETIKQMTKQIEGNRW